MASPTLGTAATVQPAPSTVGPIPWHSLSLVPSTPGGHSAACRIHPGPQCLLLWPGLHPVPPDTRATGPVATVQPVPSTVGWDVTAQGFQHAVLLAGSCGAPLMHPHTRCLADLPNAHGLSVDWVSRNLFWTSYDTNKKQINVARLDGSFKNAVIQGLDKPHGLVVHPLRG